MRLKNLSIRTGLLSLLTLVTLLLLIVSGMGIHSINQSRKSLGALNHIQGIQLGGLMNGYNLTLQARASATLAVRKIEVGLLDIGAQETERLTQHVQSATHLIQQFSQTENSSEEGLALAKNVATSYQRYLEQGLNPMVASLQKQYTDEYYKLLESDLTPLSTAFDSAIQAFRTYAQQQAVERIQDAEYNERVMGADVVGGIPHFENTREQGVSSVKFLMDLAERRGCLVDVHCDETDDPQSRFLEVLAEEARVRGMGERVTASHTVAMGSYDNAYCSKLFRLLKRSGISFISCPTESIHLQGRFDTFPKRRGVTRVAELDRAGMNVCFGQDSIKDPWYPLGNGNLLRVLDAGLHICHMMGYQDLQRCLDFVTDNSAKAMHLGENYGLVVGRPANLLILDAENDYEAVRRQAKALLSVRHGKVIMRRTPERIDYV